MTSTATIAASLLLDEPESKLKIAHSIYRPNSPATMRLETRLKELEENLEEERGIRLRCEREIIELSSEVDDLTLRLEQAGGMSSIAVSLVNLPSNL
ncbi:hypothetical protein Ciccas_013885 [Cichlidogyrus casuarinus]|uniref:Uncharacterized protein n=1 Tax=Cichlidogyrus casuarinus TaxID=1844966 RepID=A0ABD2PJF0_9PLAT